MRVVLFPVLIGLGFALGPALALACSQIEQPVHSIDPDQVGVDTQAPGAVGEVDVDVSRGVGPECKRGVCEESSCDGSGSIRLEIEPATDDMSGPDEIGYAIEFLEGELPEGVDEDIFTPTIGDPEDPQPEHPAFALENGSIRLNWSDGATDDQEAFSFTISVRAVDAAGNLGPTTEITIDDPGSSAGCGCNAAGGSERWMGLALVGVLGLCVRRRAPA